MTLAEIFQCHMHSVLKPLQRQIVPNLSGGEFSLLDQSSFTPIQYTITFPLLLSQSNVVDAII